MTVKIGIKSNPVITVLETSVFHPLNKHAFDGNEISLTVGGLFWSNYLMVSSLKVRGL